MRGYAISGTTDKMNRHYQGVWSGLKPWVVTSTETYILSEVLPFPRLEYAGFSAGTVLSEKPLFTITTIRIKVVGADFTGSATTPAANSNILLGDPLSSNTYYIANSLTDYGFPVDGGTVPLFMQVQDEYSSVNEQVGEVNVTIENGVYTLTSDVKTKFSYISVRDRMSINQSEVTYTISYNTEI